MGDSNGSRRALILAVQFAFACLGAAAWMRFIVRQDIVHGTMPFALVALLAGVTVAWLALQKWRSTHPQRCAVITGLCGGVGGAGLVLLLRMSAP
jgi:hypothetical protein